MRNPIKRRTKKAEVERAGQEFLLGPIADAGMRGDAGTRENIALPAAAFAGERVRSYVAASSWFWQCYTCADGNAAKE
jgi:hypothetical protein